MRQVAHITAVLIKGRIESHFNFTDENKAYLEADPVFSLPIEGEEFPAVRNHDEFFHDEGVFKTRFKEAYADIFDDISDLGYVGFSHDILSDNTTLDLGIHEFLIEASHLPKGLRAGACAPFVFTIGEYRYVGYLTQRIRLPEQRSFANESDLSSLSTIKTTVQYMFNILERHNLTPRISLIDVITETELPPVMGMRFDKKGRVSIYTDSVLEQAKKLKDPFKLMESVTNANTLYKIVHTVYPTQVIVLSGSYCHRIRNGVFAYFIQRGDGKDPADPVFKGNEALSSQALGSYLRNLGVTKIHVHNHNPSEYCLTLSGTTEVYVCLNDDNEVISYFYTDWFIHNSVELKRFREEVARFSEAELEVRFNNDFIKFFKYGNMTAEPIDLRSDEYETNHQFGLVAYDCGGGTNYLLPTDIKRDLVDLIFDARSEYNPISDLFNTLSQIQELGENESYKPEKPHIVMLPPIRIPVPDSGDVVAEDVINSIRLLTKGFGSLQNLKSVFVQNALYQYLINHLSQDSDRYIIGSPVIAMSDSDSFMEFWAKMNKVIKDPDTLSVIKRKLKMHELNYIECKTEKGRIF